jgi:inositol-pentakisphosphate 2-kinase
MAEALKQNASPHASHEQQSNRQLRTTAASPSAMHQALGYDSSSLSPAPTRTRSLLGPVMLSAEDRATFVSLKTSEARCCLATFGGVPNEALVCFEYFNEGGANVIFKILSWSQQPQARPRAFLFVDAWVDSLEVVPTHQRELVKKVLRVNKGLSKTLRCEEVISGFYTHVWPLFVAGAALVVLRPSKDAYMPLSIKLPDRDFTEHLMEHRGVKLFSDVMVDLTSKSKAIGVEEGRNQEQRHLTSKRWGILLPDMSPVAGSSFTLEVKPKWLAQSPTAPRDAVRCRTCALQIEKPKDTDKYFCPLRLLDGKRALVHPWILARVTEQVVEHTKTVCAPDKEQISRIASHVTAYLTSGDGRALLQHLGYLQKNLDPQGVLCRSQVKSKDVEALFDHNLRLAMTLRDCSLYIRVGYTSSGVDASTIDCKLGDLDFKSADKMDDWANKEKELLKSAAYIRKADKELDCLLTNTQDFT